MSRQAQKRAPEVRRQWLIVSILIATGFGAFSAQQVWPVLAYLAHQFDSRTQPPVLHRTPALVSTSQAPAVAAPASVDPGIARLGADDLGSRQPRALVLVDTTPGRNSREGTARLGSDPRNPQTYSVGAVLLNGARLVEIYSDYVVLERGGETVRLYVQAKQPRGSVHTSDLLKVGGLSSAQSTTQSPRADPVPRELSATEFIRPNPVYEGRH